MKYQILLIAFALIIVITEGCQKKTNTSNKPKEVVITGQVINRHNYDPKTIAIIINDLATGDQLREVSNLDENGNFIVRFERYYPQEVMLKYFSIWNIFIHPGDSIHVELDAEKMGSNEKVYHALTFSGDATKENEQLSIFNAWFSPVRKKESNSRREESRFTPEEYTLYRDSLRTKYHQLANELIENNKISEPISSWIHYEIEHNYFHNLAFYPIVHRQLNAYPKDWKVSESYYDYFKNAEIKSEFIYNSHFATSFMNLYFNLFIRKKVEQELTKQGLTRDTTVSGGQTVKFWMVNNTDSLLINGIIKYTPKEIKQFVLNRFFEFKLKSETNIETYEKYSELIEKEIKEPFLLANLQEDYEEIKQIKNASNQQNKVNIVDAKNNAGTEILKQIISNNKGKVVYINCWAIWCGPCLAEMPNSRKLMNELKDENVEFVFLCCNSPEEAAHKKVEELKLGGTHYFLNTDQTNYVQKELSFSGYPNYVLIDKNGNIVELGLVYRPGSDKTKDKILELVNEK